jgi:hypothetical protein
LFTAAATVTPTITIAAAIAAITATATAAVATPTAATARPSTTAERASAAAAFSFGTRFIYIECPTTQIGSIQGRDRALRFRFVRHFYKSKTARPTSFAIGFDTYTIHSAIRFKQGAHLIIGRTEIKVPDEYVFHCSPLI